MRSLPDGSCYVAATDYSRRWSEERHRAADLVDAIRELTFCMGGFNSSSVVEPPRVTRPRDVMERVEEMQRRKRSRQVLESSGWEEI